MATKVVDIIVERKGHILLVKRGEYWILPGGEMREGDQDMERLEEVVSREMKDRVACIFKKLDHVVTGYSPVRHDDVEVTIYVGDISSKKMSEVRDCNAHWFSRDTMRSLKVSNITKAVLEYYDSLRDEVPPSA